MNTKTPNNEKTPSENLFWVVGIGASAGGLDAFKQIIKAIPVDSGMAYILVQHLDPNHESILVELLQKSTLLPVHEITDQVHVEPDHIYVIPSNKLLTADDGILNLTERPPKSQAMSIDLFFTSLAEVHRKQAIGVVLSGTGKDGTEGLRAIKQHGGLTFAQLQQTAAYPEMPQHAINANVIDYILPPEGIIYQLLELDTVKNENPVAARPEDIFFTKILGLISDQKGVDFTYYKQTTIHRRILRGVAMKNLKTLEDFYNFLKDSPAEIDTLFEDILIPVTDFFRDAKTFDKLCEQTFLDLIKYKTTNEPLRIWVVGCSGGQEAYTMGMCLHEFFEKNNDRIKVQVFATDISEKVIIKARKGIYSHAEVAQITPERLQKFFTKVDGAYLINKSIRDICVFANHNILVDPPFANIDLISCRNVLIYMDTYLQRKIMATFHYALQPKGVLLLGKSESLGKSTDLFTTLDEVDKIYTRNTVPGRFIQVAARRKEALLANEIPKLLKVIRPDDDFQKYADEIILAKAPAGVVVNEQLEIVQFRGSTGDWLEPAPGKPSLNVLKMAKRGLVLELRSVLHKVRSTMEPFVKENISVQGKGDRKIVTIEVIPIQNTINTYFLILFKNTAEVPTEKIDLNIPGKIKLSVQETRANALEKELSQMRDDMRIFTQDQESANGELLGANEELLSNSEELRSLNEELEISKEELQSTVEELSVSNQELGFRNEQLNHSRQYAEAIVTTIREPLIILDQELRVKSANSSFYKTFNKTELETEGKMFYELENNQWDIPALRNLLERILLEKTFYDSYELKQKFSPSGERIMILNARKFYSEANSEQLILLAIEDVTEKRNIDEKLKINSDHLKAVLETSPQMIFTSSADGAITYFNQFFLNYTGLNFEQTIGWGWQDAVAPEMREEVATAWQNVITSGKEFEKEFQIKRYDGIYRWHNSHAVPLKNEQDIIISWVGTNTDIHDQKMFAVELEKQVRERADSLKKSNIALEHSNKNLEQFAFIASHDLQEPLRKIKTFSKMLSDSYSENLPAEGIRFLNKIHQSSERMSHLIQDVLNLSRIGSSENTFVNTNLNDIFTNVLNDFQLLIEEKKAVIMRGENLPVLEVVPIQINQLFYNLMSNSLKFTLPDVAPIITITSHMLTRADVSRYASLDPDVSYYEVIFSDNGIGVKEEYLDKIFQIFQRLHSRFKYSGTGIGLALCKRIAINHNGDMFASTNLKTGGLTCHIILPITHQEK